MKPHPINAGSTITLTSYDNSQCTGTSTDLSQTSGKCYEGSNYRYKFTFSAATGGSPVSAPTTVISPVSAPTTSGALTGYGFYAGYLESSCSTILFATIYPLNTCLTFLSDNTVIDVKVTATSSAYFIQQYSDSTCTVTVGTAESTRYTTECSSTKEKFFVQSSMQPPVSEAIFTIR
jgi:hypothetical protein